MGLKLLQAGGGVGGGQTTSPLEAHVSLWKQNSPLPLVLELALNRTPIHKKERRSRTSRGTTGWSGISQGPVRMAENTFLQDCHF